MAKIGGGLRYIFIPRGFGNEDGGWQTAASVISGFSAKEGIVTTMGVLSGLGEIEEYADSMRSAFEAFFPTSIAAVSFLVFNLFTVLHIIKIKKPKSADINAIEETYTAEKTTDKKTVWPVAVILSLLAVVGILAYMPWTTWGVTLFDDVTTKILECKIFDAIATITRISLGYNQVQIIPAEKAEDIRQIMYKVLNIFPNRKTN